MQVLFQTIRHMYRIEQLERKVENTTVLLNEWLLRKIRLKSQQHQIDELKGDM